MITNKTIQSIKTSTHLQNKELILEAFNAKKARQDLLIKQELKENRMLGRYTDGLILL